MLIVAFKRSIFYHVLDRLSKVGHSVRVGHSDVFQLDVAAAASINVGPDLVDVFSRQGYAQTLNRRLEVVLIDFVLATLVEEAEDLRLVSVLVFDARKHHADEVLYVVQLLLRVDDC